MADRSTSAIPALTRLSVEKFKSIHGRLDLDIRPLTILAGRNSSGKSSFMQPLLLIKQTLEAMFDPGDLRLSGPNVNFSNTAQLFSALSTTAPRNFLVGGQSEGGAPIDFIFEESGTPPIFLRHCNFFSGKNALPINIDTTLGEKEINDNMVRYAALGAFPLPVSRLHDCDYFISRERCFIDVIAFPGDMSSITSPVVVLSARSHEFRNVSASLIHIPGLRGLPARTYNLAAAEGPFPGVFNDYVASVIDRLKTKDEAAMRGIETALERLGLTWKVETRRLDDTRAEVRVARMPTRCDNSDLVNIADVGFGVSQTLPVIVALHVAKPGQLVYVEQPELHLHPKAQVELAKLLVEAANRGVRVVAETHSHLLILGIQAAIAGDEISPDDVALHWFSRDDKTGATRVDTAELDDTGAFGDWPADFADVEMGAHDRFLDLAEEKLHRRKAR